MLGLNIYIANCSRKRHGSVVQKFGPLACCLVAAMLVMADLTRHVLQDTNMWPEPGSAQYRHGCHLETFHCLSTVGILFTVVFTYLGFVILAIGTMWNAHLLEKLRDIRTQWRLIREQA